MLPTTPAGGYFRIWRRFCYRINIEFEVEFEVSCTTLCMFVWNYVSGFIFFLQKGKLHKSRFLCDGQGHNALFTHWTDVTLFSAIRTHRGHLGHAKHAEKLNTWILLRQKKNEDLTWKCSTTKCWCWWEEKRCIEPSNSIGYWGRDNQPISTTWCR